MEDYQKFHTVAEIEDLVSILILVLGILLPRLVAKEYLWEDVLFSGKSKDSESFYSISFSAE